MGTCLFCARIDLQQGFVSSMRANLFGDGWALWLQSLRCFGKLGALPLGFLCGSGRLVRYWHRRGVLWVPPTCQARLRLQSWLAVPINPHLQSPHVHMRLLCANGPLASIHKQHAHKSVWYCGSVAGAAVVWQVGCATLGFLCGSGRLVRYWHRRGVLGFPLHAMPLAERVLFPHQDPHELQVYRPWVCNLVPKPQASS